MNSTETKTELPRDWQIFREANSGGQWSEWRLNTSGKNLPAHDYRECAHVRRVDPLVDSSIRELHEQLTKQNDTLRARLEAIEKERDNFHQCLLNREESLKRSGEDWVKAKEETDRVKLELAKAEKANGELVKVLNQAISRFSEIANKVADFANMATAEAMKGEG